MIAVYDMLPVSVSQLRPIAQDYHKRVKKFIDEHIIPLEHEIALHGQGENKWTVPPVIEELKVRQLPRYTHLYLSSLHFHLLSLSHPLPLPPPLPTPLHSSTL